MVKSKSGKQQKTANKAGQKTTGLVLIAALMVLVVLWAGIAIYKAMPQVSDSNIVEVSKAYYAQMSNLDQELIAKYAECSGTKDVEAWKAFSTSWVPKISAARPAEFTKRLSNKSKGMTNQFNDLNRELFQLWTEYNATIDGEATLDPTSESNLKKNIENIKKSIELALQ